MCDLRMAVDNRHVCYRISVLGKKKSTAKHTPVESPLERKQLNLQFTVLWTASFQYDWRKYI